MLWSLRKCLTAPGLVPFSVFHSAFSFLLHRPPPHCHWLLLWAYTFSPALTQRISNPLILTVSAAFLAVGVCSLSYNNIGTQAAEAILDALKSNSTLHTLS